MTCKEIETTKRIHPYWSLQNIPPTRDWIKDSQEVIDMPSNDPHKVRH